MSYNKRSKTGKENQKETTTNPDETILTPKKNILSNNKPQSSPLLKDLEKKKKNILKEIDQNEKNDEESLSGSQRKANERKTKRRKRFTSSDEEISESLNKKKQNRNEEKEVEIEVDKKTREKWIRVNLNNADFQRYSKKYGPFEPADFKVDWKKIIKERDSFKNRRNNDEKLQDMTDEFMTSFKKVRTDLSDLFELFQKTTNNLRSFKSNQTYFLGSSEKLKNIIRKLKDEYKKEILTKLSESFYYDDDTKIERGSQTDSDDLIEVNCTIYSIITGLPVKFNVYVTYEYEDDSGPHNVVYSTNCTTTIYVHGEDKSKTLSLDKLSMFLIGRSQKKDYKLVGEYLSIVLGAEDQLEDTIRDELMSSVKMDFKEWKKL